MKFTDGFWQTRPGVHPLYALEAFDIEADERTLTVTAPTKVIASRGDTLNRPVLTVTLSSPLPNVIGVKIDHFQGGRDELAFDLVGAQPGHGTAEVSDADGPAGSDPVQVGTLVSGGLTATVTRGAPWNLEFSAGGKTLTASGRKSVGYIEAMPDAEVTSCIVGNARVPATQHPLQPANYVHEQLSLGIGELVYGLGERFGPLVKNGQTVDAWNADGGTSSEQAYKNVPFYLTNRGYGVFVNNPGHVSYEIGSEAVERVQFSVAGESLEYFLLYGPTPAEIL
jgi:alpha-D-xyloside xylohydrolase